MLYEELRHRKIFSDFRSRAARLRRHVLADTAGIGTPLMTYPLRGIGIPLVPVGSDLPKGFHDVIPPALIVQRTADRLRDERAPLAPANSAVELLDKSLVQTDVHTHAHKLTDSTR